MTKIVDGGNIQRKGVKSGGYVLYSKFALRIKEE